MIRLSAVVPAFAVAAGILAASGCVALNMPGASFKGALPPASSEAGQLSIHLREHVEMLATHIGTRDAVHYDALEAAAEYIRRTLNDAGYTVGEQTFECQERIATAQGTFDTAGHPFRNLEVQIDGALLPGEIVLIGAHYDTAGVPGADDNATGVAAALELARRFKERKPRRSVRFVFFTNEEDPFYQQESMGSLVYANRCRERGEKIQGMLSLESIGYYSDAKWSQRYPFPFSLFYPSTGNFVGFVSAYKSRALLRETVRSFRRHTQFPSRGLAAPASVDGIEWSDHWSFRQAGYPALMVTDTAPYRNPTPPGKRHADTIDYDRVARVVEGLAKVVEDLADRRDPRPVAYHLPLVVDARRGSGSVLSLPATARVT
jgi:hypothetical protein